MSKAAIAVIGPAAEPSLDDLLGDSTARLLMAADGVQEDALRAIIGAMSQARRALRD